MPSKTYIRKQLERRKAWSRNAHAAKARKRAESQADDPGWTCTGTYIMRAFAAPDGRTMELHLCGGSREWYRCGSERSVRGAVACVLRRMRNE
jgi:hypothetical protein